MHLFSQENSSRSEFYGVGVKLFFFLSCYFWSVEISMNVCTLMVSTGNGDYPSSNIALACGHCNTNQ